jgi:hypothetical protein
MEYRCLKRLTGVDWVNKEKAYEYLKIAISQLDFETDQITRECQMCVIGRELVRLGYIVEADRLVDRINAADAKREFSDEVLKAKSEILLIPEYERLLDPSRKEDWKYMIRLKEFGSIG